ncbi:MAG: chlorite dismutase, partial [Acidimicrobiaceae bacterium]|nr:chlorite dismutase [Acidimicrobiaceae bacterium]
MMEAVGVGQGLVVVHLFCARSPDSDDAAVLSAVKDATEAGAQVVTVAVLGHKAQLCFMGLHSDAWALRDLQAGLVRAGLDIVDSYVSITELSEYALGLPAEMADMRLNPKLPPPDKPAWCFYPMTKRRNVGQNWYE